MEILKTKDAAELLSVSQTTIKRWAAMIPDHFPKDRFGHYTFTEAQINLMKSIKERVDHGEALESIQAALSSEKQQASSTPEYPQLSDNAMPIKDLLSRINSIEHALDQKADEVVMVQLLQQRQELEDLRLMITQVAAAIDMKPYSNVNTFSTNADFHPVASTRLTNPPKKRGLIRSFFFL